VSKAGNFQIRHFELGFKKCYDFLYLKYLFQNYAFIIKQSNNLQIIT